MSVLRTLGQTSVRHTLGLVIVVLAAYRIGRADLAHTAPGRAGLI